MSCIPEQSTMAYNLAPSLLAVVLRYLAKALGAKYKAWQLAHYHGGIRDKLSFLVWANQQNPEWLKRLITTDAWRTA